MNAHLDPALAALELSSAAPAERAAWERHVDGCATCAAAVREGLAALEAAALGIPPVTPSPSLWGRIEGALPDRFEHHAPRLAQLLDLDEARARKLLAGIDAKSSWREGPVPAVSLYHLEGGPRVQRAVVGFIKVRAGEQFPEHRHLGREVVLVLQGSFRNDEGRVLRAGDEETSDAESAHVVHALPGADLIYLAIIDKGVDIGGDVYLPDDPRL